jgi:16S rRNA processing protein RimM
MGDEDLIAVGRVVTTHGLNGELRVQLFNPDSTSLRAGGTITLRADQNESRRRILSVRPHKRVLLMILDGCASIEEAQPLIGAELCITKGELPETGPDEIYHFDLVGMRVVTTGGEELGTVAEVMSPGSNDICIVRDGQREYLIPMIADVVKEVDRLGRRLLIEPLPGLLD